MTFEPEPGMRVHLNEEEVIEFLSLEASGPASVYVYAESGKEGTVYKVSKGQDQFALKVFYPPYRDKRLLENTDKLHRFQNLEGFRVAERTVITPEAFPEPLSDFPDLKYAVLMPWIDGTVWGNVMLETDPSLHQEDYVQIAHALTRVVSHLELQGLAHCDLSNNNFIIAKSPSGIQLIDIEDMYAPDMPRPIPDISYGTIGYRTKWIAEKGLWGPESDRFSIAVLCSEILTWHNEEIRENRSGIASFFDEEEIGEKSDRYQLMTRYLGSQSDDLPELLERAWFSTEFAQCPTIAEWRAAVRKLKALIAPEPSPYMEDPSRVATIIVRNRTVPDQAPVETGPVPEPPAVSAEENQSLPDPVVEDKIADGIHEVEREQAVPESEAEGPPEVEEPSQSEPVAVEQAESALPIGLPPKMNISLEILEFGTIGTPENSQQFSISNSGGAVLNVSIQVEEWIELSHRDFAIAPGEQQLITATLNTKFPQPKTGLEYRSASALAIESNVGSEIIGAKFKLAKPPFYESWWRRALLGAILGSLIGCFLVPIALATDMTILVIIPIVILLVGVAGIATSPRKSSAVFLILGFVLVEIISFAIILLFGLEDFSAIILGLGAGLGILVGSVTSRVFYSGMHPPQAGR